MDSKLNILKALLEFQKKVPAITKDGYNPFHKSKYSTLQGILETINPLLHDCGLIITTLPAGAMLRVTLFHVESGESLSGEIELRCQKDNDPQALGSAVTYMRRYGIASILNLVFDEDDDANGASESKNAKTKSQQAEKKSTTPPPQKAAQAGNPNPAPSKAGGSDAPPASDRPLTVKVIVQGKEAYTAGITQETLDKVLALPRTQTNAFLNTRGIPQIRYLTEEEGKKLLGADVNGKIRKAVAESVAAKLVALKIPSEVFVPFFEKRLGTADLTKADFNKLSGILDTINNLEDDVEGLTELMKMAGGQ